MSAMPEPWQTEPFSVDDIEDAYRWLADTLRTIARAGVGPFVCLELSWPDVLGYVQYGEG